MFYSYWTSASFAVLSVQRASYVISVRQTRVLSTASFRFHLAMDTLAFNYTLTTAGRIRDLHPLEFAHAGQTKKHFQLKVSHVMYGSQLFIKNLWSFTHIFRIIFRLCLVF